MNLKPTKVILNPKEILIAVMEYLLSHKLIIPPPGNSWKIEAKIPPNLLEFEVAWIPPLTEPANLDVATEESPHRLIETEEA